MIQRNITIVLAVLFLSSFAYTQPGVDETTPSVTELNSMHAPIYKLWHTAWPKKDIIMLKNIYPEIEEAFKKLESATLPGILRDKKSAWDEQLDVFRNTIKRYQTAVQNNDSSAIVAASEQVHTNYEMMVRVIRPALREIDTFHQSLYLLHHYYIVEYNLEKIKESADSLTAKIKLIQNVKLPERLVKKNDAFEKARLELTKSVNDFAAVIKSKGTKSDIVRAEQLLHAKYELLDKVFQ